ncbi:MAG: hypothetical protein GX216_08785 [Methanomicrobiales archaeon]|nr:hypothetical protein [Methanomicrobiales archaeon]
MTDRRFLLLCAGEVLVVAVGNLLAALVIQILVLAAFLDDRRSYPVLIAAVALYAATVAILGHVLLSLIVLAVILICGYAVLTLHDYRLTQWAGGSA